jgi:hypothetical protein
MAVHLGEVVENNVVVASGIVGHSPAEIELGEVDAALVAEVL